MKKLYVSFALAGALAASASAVEVTPFGHLGAFYHQGFGGLPTHDKNGKEVQAAYGDVNARIGIEIGLGSNVSIGVGGWGGYPFYSTGNSDLGDVGDKAFPKKGDVSDAYFRYDGGRLSFVLGRFDIGQFYLGKDGKNYTGVDWIYGNVQGGALNVDGGSVSLWAYWRNSQLGTSQAYNRQGYELSSFDTYQNYKNTSKIGELFSGGIDLNFGAFKLSPFVAFLTDMNTGSEGAGSGTEDVLNAGAKAQLDLGSGSLRSITTLRAVYGKSNLISDKDGTDGLTLWADEEIRIDEIWKIGAGYISLEKTTNSKAPNLLNFGDRARFYGYRGGLSGPHDFDADLGKAGSTWYVFGGMDAKRVAIDLLYAGGDYEEMSAVGSLKVWEGSNDMYFTLGAGYVGTKAQSRTDYVKPDAYQHSAFAFAKFGF